MTASEITTEIIVRNGNTPTVTLWQDGSGGFPDQKWDLLGNEANFAVRDQTHGNALRFRIHPSGEVAVEGDLAVKGTMGFVVTDAEDPTVQTLLAAPAGPEAGTYCRGTARTTAGEARVELPPAFARTTEPKGLTALLTPLHAWGRLYVAEVSPTHLVVREEDALETTFSYLVQGVRKGHASFQVQRPIPASRGGDR